jgi:pyruvate dehydrogenase E1 component alpha subunit
MIEAKTYRFFNHHGVQNLGQKYRTDEEVLAARERDPITLFEARLADIGVLDADGAAAVRAEVQAAVDEAVAFAEESPLPDPAGILADVYSDPLEVAP